MVTLRALQRSMNDILCPTDFPAADAAMSIAGLIARKTDGSVTVLHVIEKEAARQGDAMLSTKSLLSHAEERLLRDGRARAIHREGDFMKEIAHEASKDHAMMVVGTHGPKGLRQSLFGADILKLVRKVTIPSLVVQDKTPRGTSFSKIVMPVTGHADIRSLLEAVTRLALSFGAEVHVYQIMRPGEEPSDQLLRNKLLMMDHMKAAGVRVKEVNEPTKTFSVGFAAQTEIYAGQVGASCIAVMSRASDEYRWIADAEKERLLTNAEGIPVLCVV
jgi:nucleotide-binding universal stress UspA family protein